MSVGVNHRAISYDYGAPYRGRKLSILLSILYLYIVSILLPTTETHIKYFDSILTLLDVYVSVCVCPLSWVASFYFLKYLAPTLAPAVHTHAS